MIAGQEQHKGPDEYDLGNTFSLCVYTDGAKVDLIYSGQLFAPVNSRGPYDRIYDRAERLV